MRRLREAGDLFPARRESLCADLQTFHARRKKPKHSVETFANKLMAREDYIETS